MNKAMEGEDRPGARQGKAGPGLYPPPFLGPAPHTELQFYQVRLMAEKIFEPILSENRSAPVLVVSAASDITMTNDRALSCVVVEGLKSGLVLLLVDFAMQL